jgi:hypothetical protein
MNQRMPNPRARHALVVVSTVALVSAVVAAQAPATRPVETVKQVMQVLTIPASEAIFKAAGEPPTTDAAWAELQRHAAALAESGNLLMTGARVVDRGDWLKFSRALVDAAGTGAQAAAKKDADALSTASDAIYETCETCHAKYMKK